MSAEATPGTQRTPAMVPTLPDPTSNSAATASSSSSRPERPPASQAVPEPLTMDSAWPCAYVTIELLGGRTMLAPSPAAPTSNSAAKASPPETRPASHRMPEPLTVDTAFPSAYLTTKLVSDMGFPPRPPAIPKALSDTLALHSALSNMTYDIEHPMNSRRKKRLARMESDQTAGGAGAGQRCDGRLVAAWEPSPQPERRCAACSKPLNCGAMRFLRTELAAPWKASSLPEPVSCATHRRIWGLRASAASAASSSPSAASSSKASSSTSSSAAASSQLPAALKKQPRAHGVCLHTLLGLDSP